MVCPICHLETWPNSQNHANPVYCVDALKHEVESLRRRLANIRTKKPRLPNPCPTRCQCPCHEADSA